MRRIKAMKQSRRTGPNANPEMDFDLADVSVDQKAEMSGDVLQAIQGADLVVATGGGYLVDSDKFALLQVHDNLEMAIQLGKPTAMVGQGVGYIENPDLREKLKHQLPRIG